MSDDLQDRRDVAASRAGDANAFARLYDRHAAVVLSLCRRSVLGVPVDAEDALQETFIRAHRKLDQLTDPSDFRPWVYAIARRVCAERRRSAARRRHYEESVPVIDHAPEQPDAEQRESLERLTLAIDELPDRERLAIHLFYLESDPVAAGMRVLGVSRSGFYKLLTRARARLALRLREMQPS